MCQTGLSPGTPNGAPFSCLVGGGAGRERRREVGGGGGGGGANRKTDRKSSREGKTARQTNGERGTNKNDTGRQMRADRQREGDSHD